MHAHGGPQVDVRERGSWAPGVIMWVAIIGCAFSLCWAVVGVEHMIEWSRPEAAVPVALEIGEYQDTVWDAQDPQGAPFVPDGAPVTYTQARTVVQGLPASDAALLGLAEVLAGLTGAGVIGCLARIAGLLRRADFLPSLLRPMSFAALVLAVGSSAAQLVDQAARLRLRSVVVHPGTSTAPARTLDAATAATFDLTWLIAAVGIVALGVVFQRALRLQAEAVRLRVETEGLV